MRSQRLRPVGITGLGVAVPDRVLSNADLERMVETSDEWIFTRTGIRERRIVEPGTANSDLAADAGRRALADAGVSPEAVDLIIVANVLGDIQLDPDRVMTNVERYGNTSAASIPIALTEACAAGRVKDGDVVLMVAFGAGMAWASVAMRWGR